MKLFQPDDSQPPDDPQLVEAVEASDVERVRERLAAGAYADSCHPTGHTNLMIAATNGAREIFEMLLDAGADPYFQYGGFGGTALNDAASMGRSEIVDVWLGRGLDVNIADDVGNTPLMAAAAAGRIDIVRRLLAGGADMNARTVDGITAYTVARHGRHHDVVAVLHEVGATFDPNDPLLAELRAPADDEYSVIRACGTDGGTCSLSTQKIIAWLRRLDKKHPFALTDCGTDFVAGRFLSPVRDANALAVRMYEFCPDIVEQGCGSVAALARQIEDTGKFHLWWD